MLTGTSRGIGRALEEHLLKGGWRLVTINRAALPDRPGVRRVRADLSEPAQVAAAAAEIARTGGPVGLLVNNAGVLLDHYTYNSTGLELHYAVNTLAPYLLTTGLGAALAAADEPIVVTVSSFALFSADPLDVEALPRPHRRFRRLFGAYAQSKLAASSMTAALATTGPPAPAGPLAGVRLRSVDPGATRSTMTGGPGMPLPLRIGSRLFPSPERAALKVLAAAADALGGASGIYLTSRGVPRPLPRQAVLPDVQRALLAQLSSWKGTVPWTTSQR